MGFFNHLCWIISSIKLFEPAAPFFLSNIPFLNFDEFFVSSVKIYICFAIFSTTCCQPPPCLLRTRQQNATASAAVKSKLASLNNTMLAQSALERHPFSSLWSTGARPWREKMGLFAAAVPSKNRKLQVRPRSFSSSLCKNSSLSLHQRAKLPTPLLVESPGIETPAIKEKSLEEYLLEPPEPPVTPSRPGPRIRDPPAPKKRKQREEAYLEDLGDTQRLKRLKRLREALPEALENILKEHLNPRNVVLHELRFSISGEEYHVVFHSPNDEPETEFDLEELPINKRQKVLMASQKHFFLFCFLFLTSWFTPKLIDNPCHGPQCYFQAGL